MMANAAASLPTSLASCDGSCGEKFPRPTSSAATVSSDSARVARHSASRKSTATVAVISTTISKFVPRIRPNGPLNSATSPSDTTANGVRGTTAIEAM